ncbi:hypothetical protein [Azospirillum sp. B4]|uniref:hypothetical protein n=1 Tax=Azospirillum sp. B4 TaxID=95605 RepID=UPI00034B709D|nr:hypothetical protein [Azospirillum sp. B4]
MDATLVTDEELRQTATDFQEAAAALDAAAQGLRRILSRGGGYEFLAPGEFRPLLIRAENLSVALRNAMEPALALRGKRGCQQGR